MNTTQRLTAALASVAITFGLFSAVVAEATPPAGAAVMAQAASAVTVR
jgi:hypothetical protein